MGEVRENRVELEAGKRQRNSGVRERMGEVKDNRVELEAGKRQRNSGTRERMGEVKDNRVELEAGKRQRNSGARERVGEGEGKGEGGMEERKGKGWMVEDERTVVSMPHKRLTYTYYVVFTE